MPHYSNSHDRWSETPARRSPNGRVDGFLYKKMKNVPHCACAVGRARHGITALKLKRPYAAYYYLGKTDIRLGAQEALARRGYPPTGAASAQQLAVRMRGFKPRGRKGNARSRHSVLVRLRLWSPRERRSFPCGRHAAESARGLFVAVGRRLRAAIDARTPVARVTDSRASTCGRNMPVDVDVTILNW